MSAPNTSSTTFAPDATATSTSSTTSKRVDWRNYDYSEGPPKVKSTITTRDVNPYSKRQDFPSTRSSVSNGSSFHTANQVSFSNDIGSVRLNQSYSGGGGGSDTLPSNSSFSASNYLSARSFDESQLSRSGRNSVLSGFASPTNDANDGNGTAFSGSSLTYRPAKGIVTTPPTDIEDEDDYDEEEEMRIPKVKCYGENAEYPEKKEDVDPSYDFYDNRSQSEEYKKSHEDFETPTPTALNGGGRRISAFEDAWDDAQKEQKEIERKAVSDYDNSVGDETNDDVYRGRIQFDDFAGDRSKASSVNDKYSDVSVSKMEVPMTVAPVSILKNSGRFDPNVTRSTSEEPAQEEEVDNSLNHNRIDTEQGVEDLDQNDEEGTDGDDSVFEFQAQLHKSSFKSEKSKRKQRSHSAQVDLSEEDDTSIDDMKSSKKRADSLKDRTKQAWSARNKATAAAAKNNTATNYTKKERVSFHNDATVREFEPDSQKESSTQEDQDSDDDSDDETEYTEKTDYSYEDDDTYAGRSMHSVYTKSYESEAEDMIKDFFLIGRGEATNPGRRQLRFKKGRKEVYREMHKDDDTLDDTVDDTVDQPSLESRQESSSYSLGLLYNLCDDGFQAISDVLGFSGSQNDDDETTVESLLNVDTIGEWYKQASKIAFYAKEIESKQNGLCGTTSPNPTTNDEIYRTNVKSLLKMSLNAARMKHCYKHLQYDETQSLDVLTEVKVVRLIVGIPIGIGFDENEFGCVVRKIFDNGNTVIASKGDRIEVADHLASINGTNVYKKSVTEICNILAECTNTEEIHLVFLRYIGPIRNSNADEQQGYEVIDPHVGKETSSPLKLSKSLSNVAQSKVVTTSSKETENPTENSSSVVSSTTNKDTKTQNKMEKAIHKKTKGLPLSNNQETIHTKVEDNNGSKKKKRFGFFRRRKENKKKDKK